MYEIKKRNKKYQSEHKDEIKKRRKQYWADHSEELKEKSKQFRLNNPNLQKKYYKEHREKYLLFSYKKSDEEKNFICDLTEEWIRNNILLKPCYYCQSTEDIGCDRIDNTKGHTMNNVLPACYTCNAIRGFCDFSIEEMVMIGQTKKIVFDLRANRSRMLKIA